MKASKAIPLILIGTIIAGCEDEAKYAVPPPAFDKVMQSSYKSKGDCEKDWGSDARDCKPHPTGGGYVGPRYIYNHAAGNPMALDANGSVRPLPNSYLSPTRTGAQSVAFATVGSPAPASVSEAGAARSGFSGARAGTSSVGSRGGFGATGHAAAGTSGG